MVTFLRCLMTKHQLENGNLEFQDQDHTRENNLGGRSIEKIDKVRLKTCPPNSLTNDNNLLRYV